MDAQVLDIISSVGFPIFACCVMAYFINFTYQEFQKVILENNGLLKALTEWFIEKDKHENDTKEA